jgi:ribulose-phosphate 3-epimerase
MGKRSQPARSTERKTGRGSGVQIAPSILSADFSRLAEELHKVKRASCTWIHLDIMDGHFVPNLTFGAPVVKALRSVDDELFFDAHLMIENPKNYLKEFADAGVQLLTIHQEACGDETPAMLKAIRKLGMQAGVSIRPKTPLGVLDNCLEMVDLVLIMSVEPGFGGQKLIPSTLNKVRQLVLERENRRTEYVIQVDGGINAETAPLAVAAGADVLVAGSAVFRDGRVRENVRALRQSLCQLK